MDNNTKKSKTKLEQMEDEVREVHIKLNNFCKENNEFNKIYKGCLIYGSPLYKNPNILFFGINPGGSWDYYKENGFFKPQQYNPNGYGVFWEEIKECLKRIKKKELIENMVITNRYFFATDNTEILKKQFFEKYIKKYYKEMGFKNEWEVANKQEEWTRTIIEELSPKLIIAGGRTIWERFNFLNPEIIEKQCKNIKILKINKIILIAYQRIPRGNKMSNETKKEFIEYLEKYTNEL